MMLSGLNDAAFWPYWATQRQRDAKWSGQLEASICSPKKRGWWMKRYCVWDQGKRPQRNLEFCHSCCLILVSATWNCPTWIWARQSPLLYWFLLVQSNAKYTLAIFPCPRLTEPAIVPSPRNEALSKQRSTDYVLISAANKTFSDHRCWKKCRRVVMGKVADSAGVQPQLLTHFSSYSCRPTCLVACRNVSSENVVTSCCDPPGISEWMVVQKASKLVFPTYTAFPPSRLAL